MLIAVDELTTLILEQVLIRLKQSFKIMSVAKQERRYELLPRLKERDPVLTNRNRVSLRFSLA